MSRAVTWTPLRIVLVVLALGAIGIGEYWMIREGKVIQAVASIAGFLVLEGLFALKRRSSQDEASKHLESGQSNDHPD